MAKKISLPPKTPITMPAEAEGIVDEVYTEGKGVLKRTVTRFNQDFWNQFKEMIRETRAREDSVEIRNEMKDRLLESLIRGFEDWAKYILDRANLPHNVNNGKLTDLVESRGFPFGKVEWHAAAILDTTRRLRTVIEKGDVVGVAAKAIRLGELMEQRLRFGYVAERTQPGGKGRGEQQTKAREEEWAKWQADADRLRGKYPSRSEFEIAETIQGNILRKEKRHVGIRTITNRIRKPSP